MGYNGIGKDYFITYFDKQIREHIQDIFDLSNSITLI